MGEVKNFADYVKPDKKLSKGQIIFGVIELVEAGTAGSVVSKASKMFMNATCDALGLKNYKFGVKVLSNCIGLYTGKFVIKTVDPLHKRLVRVINSIEINKNSKEEEDGRSEDGEHQTEQSQVKGDE